MKKLWKWDARRTRILCACGLVTLTGLTAVWTRQALAGRKAGQVEVGESKVTAEAAVICCLPMNGREVRGYSPAEPIWSDTLRAYEAHEGIDLAGDGVVYACGAGKVIGVENAGRYGLTIAIAHEDGGVSEYASLNDAAVKAGQSVRAGQVIGHAGTSAVCERALGSHLHFCYYEGGEIAPPPFTITEE